MDTFSDKYTKVYPWLRVDCWGIHGSNAMDTPWIRVYPCVTMDTRDAVDTPWIQMYPRVSMDTFSHKYTKVYPWIRVDTYVSMAVWIQIGIHREIP